MAALVTKQSQLPMTRRVQRTFWHSNAIKLKYTQKKASKSSPAAKQYTGKLRLLFRNAHAVSKNKKSLADYQWLCDLDEVKGLAIGATYRNSKACGTFTKYIATAAQSQVAEELTNAKFVSVTSDSATDSSITEQEIVFVHYSSKGVPFTKFVGLKQPISPNAIGLHKAIMAALGDVGLGEEDLKKKLVGFGASVMVGKKGGVSAFLTQLQPSCITVHCFAHHLELAYKDAVKENKLYDSCIVLLMGLYYFYHNSPKHQLCQHLWVGPDGWGTLSLQWKTS